MTSRQRPVVLPAMLLTLGLLAAGCSKPADPPSTAPSAAASPPAAATSSAPPAAVAAKLVWKDCDGAFSCSSLDVPLDDRDPGGGTVALALVRKRATGRDRIGSLLLNPGGPGASAVGFLEQAYTEIPAGVRARFDLVAFDPRGVGRSAPVRCETTAQLDRYFALDPTPDSPDELRAYDRGNVELAAGCARRSGRVLPHVATAEAAADMDRVRAALGDDKLTYLGFSYGTSIGAAYLDRYPTRVRAMVLDGALDPTLTWDGFLSGQSKGFDTALQAFLADCERVRCPFREAVTGALGTAYDALAMRVDGHPLSGAGDRTVGPGEFSLGVGAGLYDRQYGWPAIAAALKDAERGDGRRLLALSDGYLERGPDGYANVSEANLAVNCIDRPWPKDLASYVRLADRVSKGSPRFGEAIALSGLGCRQWPVQPVSRPHPVTGKGAPPVLVIGTTRDPATPYAWAVGLSRQLTSGVLLTNEGDGHTVYRADAKACIREPVDTYLLTGRAPAPVRC